MIAYQLIDNRLRLCHLYRLDNVRRRHGRTSACDRRQGSGDKACYSKRCAFALCARSSHTSFLLQMSQKAESNMTCKKLHCRGIKEDHTEDGLRDYFSSYGNIESVKIVRDPNTNQVKGFAFVTFDDYDPVDRALCKSFYLKTSNLSIVSCSGQSTYDRRPSCRCG